MQLCKGSISSHCSLALVLSSQSGNLAGIPFHSSWISQVRCKFQVGSFVWVCRCWSVWCNPVLLCSVHFQSNPQCSAVQFSVVESRLAVPVPVRFQSKSNAKPVHSISASSDDDTNTTNASLVNSLSFHFPFRPPFPLPGCFLTLEIVSVFRGRADALTPPPPPPLSMPVSSLSLTSSALFPACNCL